MSAKLLGCAALCCSLASCSRELPAERVSTLVHEAPARSKPKLGSGVAVVELFTSEGCSSCPPADHVLAELAARAASESLPVYPLAFHVDYWNGLGWRDRFSRSSYSDRQQGYSAIGASGSVYTPQIVVNGEAECVGSQARQVDALIAAARQHEPRSQIELSARRSELGIQVSYRVNGDTRDRVLNLALVEARAESQVENGENAGAHLVHVNVVRVFTTRSLTAETSGRWSVRPDPDFADGRLGVVAFAQGVPQGNISGASAVEL